MGLKSFILKVLKISDDEPDNFDYKNAEKFYNVEIQYKLGDDMDLEVYDKKLASYMKMYNAEWIASDCGPFYIGKRVFKRELSRCNNYNVPDINFDIKKFKAKLPPEFRIDFVYYVQFNNDREVERRVKIPLRKI